MRVLVTGANGYLGAAVADVLRESGYDVVGLIHNDRSRVPDGVPVRCADLLDPRSLRAAVQDIDVVCHLAGLTRVRESYTDPERYFDVNAVGTAALLRAMESAGVAAMVFASTAAIYGAPEQQPMAEDLPDNPPHPYAASKRAAEQSIEAEADRGKLAAVILRLFNVAGGPDPDSSRILPRILSAAAGRSALTVHGDGSSIRDYVHITDAASAFSTAISCMPEPGKCVRYNIGSGVGISVRQLIDVVSQVTGRDIPIEHRPAVAQPPRLVSDSDRARRELCWTATNSDIRSIVREAWSCRSTPHERPE
ncbi:NAD-dependent epimerase/dehydratase family protein [Nocardia sp. NPDC051463]|uniref:NAD-dependent epimerase/dehydratase family protein n=1 Tax=Nocardia sp. NPDC051463 TaxID=3154845 RepID=UPI00344E9F17